MPELRFASFATPFGGAALVWRDKTIVGCLLPESDDAALRVRLARRYPGAVETAPDAFAASAMARIAALLGGADDDLADLPLDMAGIAEFERRAYALARSVRPGETLTYGEAAARLGAPNGAQAMGRAMGRNPFPPIVPCHRVVAAGAKLGGFSAAGGRDLKRRLLAVEARHARDGLFAGSAGH